MPQQEKPSQPSHGEGPSRHEGTEQHGWSPDVDATEQQQNESAQRSFHPDEYAPESGTGRQVSEEETTEVPGDTVESSTQSGEEYADDSDEEGIRHTGTRGVSQRPSGEKDASAYTGVDPQEPSSDSD
jgi:hypothetical protein